jgi:hypothetical protein
VFRDDVIDIKPPILQHIRLKLEADVPQARQQAHLKRATPRHLFFLNVPLLGSGQAEELYQLVDQRAG